MIRRLIPVTLLVLALTPLQALAYPRNVERWRVPIRTELKRQGVWSAFIEDKALHIIQSESSGIPTAGKGRSCQGLFQFQRGWSRGKDRRLSGYWSVTRFVTAYRQGGLRSIKRHWRATYY